MPSWLAIWANQHLKIKHPGLTITEGKWGGTYGQVRADTVGGEVHHTPANEVTEETKALGYGFWMERSDHIKTASYGRKTKAKAYRARQGDLINQGQYDQAQLEDLRDVKRIGQGLYDIPVLQMLKTKQRNQNDAAKNKR